MTKLEELNSVDTDNWDLEIHPKKNLFDLNLKEVWAYKDLMLLFVKRDFTASYKQTILGPLWHLLQPVFTTVVFLVVFNNIAHISTNDTPPVLFYMSGITIWSYFSICFTSTSNTFVANAGIFGKVYFPRLVLPLSVVIANMIRFFIQFALLFVIMIMYTASHRYSLHISFSWLFIPVELCVMAVMGLGLGIIISSLTTKYRDFSVLIGFAVQLLMYATPVAYPMSAISDPRLKVIIQYNPLSSLVENFRYILFHSGHFDANGFAYSVVFTFVVFVVGLVLFNKVEQTFMDTV